MKPVRSGLGVGAGFSGCDAGIPTPVVRPSFGRVGRGVSYKGQHLPANDRNHLGDYSGWSFAAPQAYVTSVGGWPLDLRRYGWSFGTPQCKL